MIEDRLFSLQISTFKYNELSLLLAYIDNRNSDNRAEDEIVNVIAPVHAPDHYRLSKKRLCVPVRPELTLTYAHMGLHLCSGLEKR